MFEALKKLLGDNQEALAELANVEKQVKVLSTEVGTLESKLNGTTTNTIKLNEIAALFKAKLGLETDDINEDLINEKINALKGTTKNDESFKAELANLEKIIKDKELALQEKDKMYKDRELDFSLEREISKLTSFEAVSPKANEILMREIKANAALEEGKLVFKNTDGTILRDTNGLPVDLNKRLSTLKESEDYAFCFKSSAQSGSGVQTNNAQSYSGYANLSAADKEMLAHIEKSGLRPEDFGF